MISPDEFLSAANLAERFRTSFGIADGQVAGLDLAQLRYVIYARKSTDSSEKQERSISDQLHECRRLAEVLGLRVIGPPLHEEFSAKVSGKRPIFSAMIAAIEAGKYDGIITWSADRLARNMKEAGEIIDLLDKGVIKDLKFANHQVFGNDPSGKMMLGLTFVMAKQYSDQHGQNVDRAIRRKTAEGKYAGSGSKHGYYKDGLHYLRPDGENWDLIKEVFAMRLRKAGLLEIATWLQAQGYPRKTKHTTPKKIFINIKFLSDLLRDPFYAGVSLFGKQVTNLGEKYDFVPIITPEQYDEICKEGGVNKKFLLSSAIKTPGTVKADLLRGMVACGECERNMSTGITRKKYDNGKIESFFYLRCDTPECKRKGKSVRAKLILEAVFAFFEKHPLGTKEAYDRYVPEMTRIIDQRQKDLDAALKSLQIQNRHLADRISDDKEQLRIEEDALLKREYKNDLKEKLEKAKEFEKKILDLKRVREEAKATILTYEQFIELFGNLAERIQKTGNMKDLDYILRKLFSNFVVKDGIVTQITQNSPFGELCGSNDCSLVAPRGVEPLLTA